MSTAHKVADILQKGIAFSLAGASVYLAGNLMYGLNKVGNARKQRLAEVERTGKTIEQVLEDEKERFKNE